jgi:hypothetical protein
MFYIQVNLLASWHFLICITANLHYCQSNINQVQTNCWGKRNSGMKKCGTPSAMLSITELLHQLSQNIEHRYYTTSTISQEIHKLHTTALPRENSKGSIHTLIKLSLSLSHCSHWNWFLLHSIHSGSVDHPQPCSKCNGTLWTIHCPVQSVMALCGPSNALFKVYWHSVDHPLPCSKCTGTLFPKNRAISAPHRPQPPSGAAKLPAPLSSWCTQWPQQTMTTAHSDHSTQWPSTQWPQHSDHSSQW